MKAFSWLVFWTSIKTILNLLNLNIFFIKNLFQSTIRGRIDQVNQVLELESNTQGGAARYNALQKWCEQLSNLNNSIVSKIVV